MNDEIRDTRLAFQPGSGFFGWMLIPDVKIVGDDMAEGGGYTTIPVDEYHGLLRSVREMGTALRVIRGWAAAELDERTASCVPALRAAAVMDLCDRVLRDGGAG